MSPEKVLISFIVKSSKESKFTADWEGELSTALKDAVIGALEKSSIVASCISVLTG